MSRYRRVIVLGCLVLAVLVPALILTRPRPVQAEALIASTAADADRSAVTRYGEATFASLHPDRRLSLVSDGGYSFHVIGRDPDRRTAITLANHAARSLVQVLNAPGAGIGGFVLALDARPLEPAGGMSLAAATALAAALLVAALALVLTAAVVLPSRLWHRPRAVA